MTCFEGGRLQQPVETHPATMGTRLERTPLCSAIMQMGRHTAYINVKYPKVLAGGGLCILRVQSGCRKSSTDPVPGPPHPLCRQRAEEIRIRDTGEAPLRCSRLRERQAGVAEAHRHGTIIIHGETHLRMRCIGDLKGQIRWFLTLAARSLPVFTKPNASPSAPSVCPLLNPPPFFPLSLLPSDPVTAALTRELPNKHFQTFIQICVA